VLSKIRGASITWWGGTALGVLVLAMSHAAAEIELPSGFTARVYVTGDGFDANSAGTGRGIPSTSTLSVDRSGALYLARTGRRYFAGTEVEDIWPLYRIPVGGARLTPDTEARFLYGPPLPNAQIGAMRDGRELFVTTYDRERKLGVLYRIAEGRAEFVAGGTPERGRPPVLRQPEGVAIAADGASYVADRAEGLIVRLDASGRVLDPRFVAVTRPRVLALDGSGSLWVGSDGAAEAPWQQAPGEILEITPDGAARVVLRGPMAQALGVSPGGHLVVADRQGAQLFALTREGARIDLARFTDGDAPRGFTFAPVTPETQRAGIAGDLFVVVIHRGAFAINEVLRISGPLDELIRARRAAAR
jgi:hypothetical protein